MAQSENQAELAALTARIQRALELLGEPVDNWVPPHPAIDRDVVIVGAGQAGLAIGFALTRKGIRNIAIIDEADNGQEGPWITTARMLTLRSPKNLAGPEQGIAELTFQAWYQAAYGAEAYDQIDKIHKDDWMRYLNWYRQMIEIGLEIDNQVRLIRIEPASDSPFNTLRLTLQRRAGDKIISETITTRKVILANGMDGAGRPYIPELVKQSLPKPYWAHSAEPIDFEYLRAKQIAVLGAASSAFDNAAVALETGAARVDLFCRHESFARINLTKGMSYPGILDHFFDLPDDLKWRAMSFYFNRSTPAVRETVQRCTHHDHFFLHFASPWQDLSLNNERIQIKTPKAQYQADYLILGTGFETNPATRSELKNLSSDIALWKDKYQPTETEQNPSLAQYPYLGSGFEFLEKQPGNAPWLANIHCYNYAAVPSFGRAAGDIGSLKHGIPRLIQAISKDLILADAEHHVERIMSFSEPEMTDTEIEALHKRYFEF